MRENVEKLLAALGVTGASDDPLLDFVISNVEQQICSRTVNGKPLTENISLVPSNLGLGKALTFTGAISGSYNGTVARTFNIPFGKRTCRFVVGTSTAGWTVNDCDYLCDGIDDQVEINAAIQALPDTGGEVVLLDGTYKIASPILLDKGYTILKGSGAGTILLSKDKCRGGIIHVVSDFNVVSDLTTNGQRFDSYGIGITGNHNIVVKTICIDNNGGGIVLGLSNNTIYDTIVTPVMIQNANWSYLYVVAAWLGTRLLAGVASLLTSLAGLPEVKEE